MAAKTEGGLTTCTTSLAKARRDREQRDHGFRAHALQRFPPVCARCGRATLPARNYASSPSITGATTITKVNQTRRTGANWEPSYASTVTRMSMLGNEVSRRICRAVLDATPPCRASSPSHQPFAGLDKSVEGKPQRGLGLWA